MRISFKRTLFILSLAALMVGIAFTPVRAAINEIVWKKFFADGTINRVAVDRNGNVIVTGELGGGIAFIRKLSGGGRVLWTRELEVSGDETDVFDVAVDADGYIYVVGGTFRHGDQDYIEHAFIRKYGPKGGHHWTRQFSGDSLAIIRGVDVGPGGNIYIVGLAKGALPNMPRASETYDAFIRKYNPSGKIYWTRQFSLNDFKGATTTFDVAVGPGGGAYVVGTHYLRSQGSGELFLKKFSPRGGEYWTRYVNRLKPYNSVLSRMAVDRAGEVVITSIGMGTSADGFTVKYSHKGRRLWTRPFNSHSNFDVTVDRDRNIYVVGRGDNDKAFNRKYSPSGSVRWTRYFVNGGAFGAAADPMNNVYVVGRPDTGGAVSFLAKFRR